VRGCGHVKTRHLRGSAFRRAVAFDRRTASPAQFRLKSRSVRDSRGNPPRSRIPLHRPHEGSNRANPWTLVVAHLGPRHDLRAPRWIRHTSSAHGTDAGPFPQRE